MTAPDRVMRTMKYAFVVSVLLVIFVAVKLPSKAAHPPQHLVEILVAFVGLVNVTLGLNARRFWSRFSQGGSGRNRNASAVGQWFAANVFALAMIESCALFAFALHLLGSSTTLVVILFACGLLALVVWNPGTPPATDTNS